MKNIYSKYTPFFLLTLLVISLGACKKDDSLNVTPKGFLTDATTFSSESNADLVVNDIYNQLPDGNNEYVNLTDAYADNVFCGASWETGESTVRKGSINPNNVPTGIGGMWDWEGSYSRIRKCNDFLQQVAKNKANFSADWYATRVGEVTYLRALFYTFLFTNYGGVPIITTPLDNTAGGDIFFPRSTIDQTLSFIETDCDAAAAALPLTPKENGRATKGAALTLKGWAELFAASPLVNSTNDKSKWTKAAVTNKQVMDLNVYHLFSIDTAAYYEQFLGKNNWNSETIFARGYAAPLKGGHREGYLGPVFVNGVQQSWGNLAPTQNLVDDYAMDNGLPITDPASGYDDQHPYVHRESRFYQSILYDGATWQGDIFKSRTGGSNQIDLGSTSDITNTGYNGRKTLDESILGQTSINLAPSVANYILFRYAEVLLSYAEAQNEATGPDASVYDAVNQVRARSSLPAVKPGLTQSQMRDYIHRERRIELAFEDKRWFDIRRWDITAGATGVLNTPEYGMQITVDPVSKKLVYTRVKIYTNIFYERQNWMPIPQGEIDKNTKLTQNPGY